MKSGYQLVSAFFMGNILGNSTPANVKSAQIGEIMLRELLERRCRSGFAWDFYVQINKGKLPLN